MILKVPMPGRNSVMQKWQKSVSVHCLACEYDDLQRDREMHANKVAFLLQALCLSPAEARVDIVTAEKLGIPIASR